MANLSAQDASFLERAAPGTPLNVAGVLSFERRPGGLTQQATRRLVEERLDRLPALRRMVTAGSGAARWADDPNFSVDRHVGVTGFTADADDLLAQVATLHATPLPADRPLWRLDVVPQGATGGPKLLFRASHALADGLSSMAVMRAMFDTARSTASSTSESASRPPGTSDEAVDDPPGDDAFTVARDIWDSFDERRRSRLAEDDYERALTLLDGWISLLSCGSHGLPRLSATGPVRTRVTLTEVDSPSMRALRRRAGARFDAVSLTVVAAAVGRLLHARGELPPTTADGPRIRTLVPMATSFAAGTGQLGNHASFLLLALPIGAMDPAERLQLVAAELDEALAAGQHRAAEMSMRALETAPPELTDRINSFTTDRQFVDLVVSCIPGSRRQMTFDGLPLAVTHAVLPITEHVRLAIGWSDIAGRSGIAITSDDGALPEREFLRRAIEQAAVELAERFGVGVPDGG